MIAPIRNQGANADEDLREPLLPRKLYCQATPLLPTSLLIFAVPHALAENYELHLTTASLQIAFAGGPSCAGEG
eukprot:2635118-Pleurochrysis_carterae.AAC.2